MPDSCVLDSSIIAAIFFREEASKKAAQLAADKNLYTVNLALAEVANVAWKRVNLFGEDKELIEEALNRCMEFINTSCEVIDMSELIDPAFNIAVGEKLTMYDSLFLAAAERKKLPLYTLDKKLKINDNIHLL